MNDEEQRSKLSCVNLADQTKQVENDRKRKRPERDPLTTWAMSVGSAAGVIARLMALLDHITTRTG